MERKWVFTFEATFGIVINLLYRKYILFARHAQTQNMFFFVGNCFLDGTTSHEKNKSPKDLSNSILFRESVPSLQ